MQTDKRSYSGNHLNDTADNLLLSESKSYPVKNRSSYSLVYSSETKTSKNSSTPDSLSISTLIFVIVTILLMLGISALTVKVSFDHARRQLTDRVVIRATRV